jgi:hypothetical protein
MAKRTDILLDENGNYRVENGDFVVGESDDQHVELLLVSTKGSFREYPTLGTGIVNWVKKQNIDLNGLEREIKVNLQADGYKAGNLNIAANGEFNMDYEINY